MQCHFICTRKRIDRLEDAPINSISFIQPLEQFDDDNLRTAGLKIMQRHSGYLSQELVIVALFSGHLTLASGRYRTTPTDLGCGHQNPLTLPSPELRLKWVIGPSGLLAHAPGTISLDLFRQPRLFLRPRNS